MLHSGSRGVGNAIGTLFIELAKQDGCASSVNLPDRDLAYFAEGTAHFDDYVRAVGWAQEFAAHQPRADDEARDRGREDGDRASRSRRHVEAVNCHHNYVQQEHHFGEDVLVTRKGAVSARPGELGIIPGSMGARSYIVRGKGNPESFE